MKAGKLHWGRGDIGCCRKIELLHLVLTFELKINKLLKFKIKGSEIIPVCEVKGFAKGDSQGLYLDPMFSLKLAAFAQTESE